MHLINVASIAYFYLINFTVHWISLFVEIWQIIAIHTKMDLAALLYIRLPEPLYDIRHIASYDHVQVSSVTVSPCAFTIVKFQCVLSANMAHLGGEVEVFFSLVMVSWVVSPELSGAASPSDCLVSFVVSVFTGCLSLLMLSCGLFLLSDLCFMSFTFFLICAGFLSISVVLYAVLWN